MGSTYGIDLLDRGDWTAERFGQALATDLALLESGGESDPLLESSISRVMDLLGHHALSLILEGRFEALRSLAREVADLFSRFPRLPFLRELPLRQRAGARLDVLLGQLRAVQSLPSRNLTDSLFDPASRGAAWRSKTMDCLFGEPSGLSTQELMKRTGVELRQSLHLILRRLREQGLVISEPMGQTQHHQLSPSGRHFWENRRQPEAAVATSPVSAVASSPAASARA